jgi:hypothetical protein
MLKMQKTIGRQPLFPTTLAIIAMLPFVVAPVAAQDTTQTSSGELKDFRLDSPPPKDKEPEPTPKQEAPVAQQQAQESAQQRPALKSEAPKKVPVRRTEPRDANPPVSEDAIVEVVKPTSDLLPPSSTLPAAVPAQTSATVAAKEDPATDYRPYWTIFAALIAALASLAIWVMWRRRKSAEAAPGEFLEREAISPAPIADPAPDVPQPTLKTKSALKPRPAATDALAVEFTPDNARLSVANLTVTGRLHLHYLGKKPLGTLRLRTLMISACDGQNDIINSFHSDPQMGQINSLNAVAPGEEIKMKLELQLPRDALQAFDWRERRFVAPIVLIHIDSEKQSIEPIRITSLVGQDGGPGSVRLQPIPVDRGPKLFYTLQFRPIAA